MRRAFLLVMMITGLAAAAAACGDAGGGGLSVLAGSPSASPSPSAAGPSLSVSPAVSPTASVAPSPSISGSGSDPFAEGELTAAELKAYAAQAAPIYNKVTRYGGEVSYIVSQLPETQDLSWNPAATQIEEYAQKIEAKRAQWDAITPPPQLAAAHAALAAAFATEQGAYELLAGNLRGGSAQPPGWGDDVQAELDQASEGYQTFTHAIADEVRRLHVNLAFQFPD